MYKNLAAALAAACCFHLSCFAQPTVTAPAGNVASVSVGMQPNVKILNVPPAKASLPVVKAAWVFVAPIMPQGWVAQHEAGRKAVQAAMGAAVQTSFVENVPEGADAERVIRDLALQGNHIIFTPSFGYMEPTLKVAREFPHVKFESITGYKQAENVATANARYYQGRYLAGVAAGRVATQLGYLGGFAVPEVLQGINAFALGARSVNPKATVRVVWLNQWFNPPKEREAANALFNQGIEVLAFHTGSNAPMAVAQERGKLAIGYHSDMSSVGPTAQLLAVTHHWDDYYLERVRAVAVGNWRSSNEWRGLANNAQKGAVRVGFFGPAMPASFRAEIVRAQASLASGQASIFKGPLTDNLGVERVAAGISMQDPQILGMDWLVAGVLGSVR